MASSLLFCTRCGTANQQQASFCFSCGNSLQHAASDAQNSGNPSPDAANTLAPEHLLKDRYHILSRLGQGGMGAVYKARDTLFNNRLVAVKEMSQSGLSTQQRAGAADDFKREAHMLADLHHSGLPTIYDYFSDAGQWYLVMDFIAGKTLEEHLADNKGWLPIKQALSIGKQLCQVLDYLHTRQPPIIFRDLKPANVMYTANGQVCLIDFGIARHFKPGQLKDTVSFGSAGYAAPEQYGKTQTTPRSDIYSFGVILHQCLSGNDPANNSPTPFDFPPLDLHGQTAPATLSTLIKQMLAMNPSTRPASMSNVLLALERISGELALLEQAPTSAPARPAAPAPQAKSPISTLKPPRPPVPRIPDRRTPAPGQPAPVTTPSSPTSGVYRVTPEPVAQQKTTTYRTHYNRAGSVQALCWSPTGDRVVLGDNSGMVQVWDADLTHPIYTYRSHASAVRALAWSPGGDFIALGDKSGLLEIWRASNGERIYTYCGYSVEVTGIAWSPDSIRIACGDSQGRIIVQDAHNGGRSSTLRGAYTRVEAIAWSPAGPYLAGGDSTGLAQIWDAMTQQSLYSYAKHEASITALAYSPDGKCIASSDSNGRIHVWEPVKNGFSYVYQGHFGAVAALAWSPNGRRIASAGEDTSVQLWNARAGTQVFSYREHTAPLLALGWSPDGQRIISSSANKIVHLWQAREG